MTTHDTRKKPIAAGGADTLGRFLRAARTSAWMTEWDVERYSGGRVTRAMTEAVESGAEPRPEPTVLAWFSHLYKVKLDDLLARGGYRPDDAEPIDTAALETLLDVAAELTASELAELTTVARSIRDRHQP